MSFASKISFIGFLGLVCSFVFTPTVFARTDCAFSSAPSVVALPDNQGTLHIWSEADPAPGLFKSLSEVPPLLADFQAWARVEARDNETTTDPLDLLKRQRVFFARAMGNDYVTRRFDPIISGKIGKIVNIGCLESLLFDEFFVHQGEKSQIEFAAVVMSRADQNQKTSYKIYLFFSDLEWGVSFPQRLTDMIQADRVDPTGSWTYLLHFHNHPFYFGNTDIAGTTIPSDPDVQLYRSQKQVLDLGQAWISNGISTIQIPAEQFQSL